MDISGNSAYVFNDGRSNLWKHGVERVAATIDEEDSVDLEKVVEGMITLLYSDTFSEHRVLSSIVNKLSTDVSVQYKIMCLDEDNKITKLPSSFDYVVELTVKRYHDWANVEVLALFTRKENGEYSEDLRFPIYNNIIKRKDHPHLFNDVSDDVTERAIQAYNSWPEWKKNVKLTRHST